MPSFQDPQTVFPFPLPQDPSVVLVGVRPLGGISKRTMAVIKIAVVSPPDSRIKVDTPCHGTAKTLIIRPGLLLLDGIGVVVPNPLIVPRDFLHVCVGQVPNLGHVSTAMPTKRRNLLWSESFLFDEILNFGQAHGPLAVSARTRLAGPLEGTAKSIAIAVRHGVASSV